MSKPKSNIEITVEGINAAICIKGMIWEFDASYFEYQINELIANGVKNCEIEINSIGGNVFAANAMANLIDKFPGTVSCRIGSICASAATYIAVKCKKRVMAKNGQFMIHKPQMPSSGNEDEQASNLKLLKNLTKDYKRTYAKATGLSEEEIEAMWKLDYWMDAEEALEKGFITEIENTEAEISDEVVALLEQMKHPKVLDIKASLQTQKSIKFDKMKYPLITAAIGLQEDATEQAIASKIAEINAKNLANETLITELKSKLDEANAKAEQAMTAKVTALIDGALAANKITAADKDRFTKLAKQDYETTSEIIASMKPYTSITAAIESSKVADAQNSKYADWDFDKFRKEAPKVLAEMQIKEPERFNKLKQDWLETQK